MQARGRLRALPPVQVDLSLALLVAGLELARLFAFQDEAWRPALSVPLLALASLPLIWRRALPFLSLATVGGATIALAATGVPHLGLGVIAGLYSLALYEDIPPLRALAAAIAVLGTVLVPLLTADSAADLPRNAALYAAAWAVGALQRNRRRYTAELEARTAELEREREANARLAAQAERARIARELHDVVAHSLSVITVQAQAARLSLRAAPSRGERALERIEAVGRESLTEMRRLLGRLRAEEDVAERDPQPGLARVDELVDRFRSAGLQVALEVRGTPRALSESLDLSAYRILQEALTNALRHAGPSPVTVGVRYGPGELLLEVIDEGSIDPVPGNGGHGLVGIRERAALLGGSVAIGPRPGGGFRVAARLPLPVP